MKNLVISTIFTTFFFSACTQSINIKRTYAFSQIVNAGIHLTDEKGNETAPDSQLKIYIYLESKGPVKPKIFEVVYHGKSYKNPPVYLVSQVPVEVGTNSNDGRVVTLSPANGNNFCRIELTLPFTGANTNERRFNIAVSGEKNGQHFSVKISKEIALQTAVGV